MGVGWGGGAGRKVLGLTEILSQLLESQGSAHVLSLSAWVFVARGAKTLQSCRQLRRDLARPVGVIICFLIPPEKRSSRSSYFLPGLARKKKRKKTKRCGLK